VAAPSAISTSAAAAAPEVPAAGASSIISSLKLSAMLGEFSTSVGRCGVQLAGGKRGRADGPSGRFDESDGG
jgi:hypothetical protein